MNQDAELPGQGCRDRAASTGLQGQDNLDRIERRRQPEKERHARQLEQDSQNGASSKGAARIGLVELDCKDRTNRTGLPAQGCKNKTNRARQKGEDSRKDSQNRTAR
jgi:hypothetical protein